MSEKELPNGNITYNGIGITNAMPRVIDALDEKMLNNWKLEDGGIETSFVVPMPEGVKMVIGYLNSLFKKIEINKENLSGISNCAAQTDILTAIKIRKLAQCGKEYFVKEILYGVIFNYYCAVMENVKNRPEWCEYFDTSDVVYLMNNTIVEYVYNYDVDIAAGDLIYKSEIRFKVPIPKFFKKFTGMDLTIENVIEKKFTTILMLFKSAAKSAADIKFWSVRKDIDIYGDGILHSVNTPGNGTKILFDLESNTPDADIMTIREVAE